MQNLNLFSLFTDILHENNIEYFITGSVASIIYGEPRLTHDIDLIVSLNNSQVDVFVKAFAIDNFYCPPIEVIKTELKRETRGHFNLIHHETGFKADIYLVGKDEFQIWAMNNKKVINFLGKELYIAPPEYVIIKKLEFFIEGKSEKHLLDIKSILRNSIDLLDLNFISSEAKRRNLLSLWQSVQ